MLSVTKEQLLSALTVTHHTGQTIRPFSSLACHSASVTPHTLFFAVPGTTQQGIAFIQEALQKGATGLVVDQDTFSSLPSFGNTICQVGVEDVRLALAQAAPLFFPQSPTMRAAVTGTNGKTSIAHFTRQLWNACGKQAASLGTLGLGLEVQVSQEQALTYPQGFATPDPIFLHQCFDWLGNHRVTHCILEASSHGLHQKRLHGTSFQIGVWTNVFRDHLDYHPTLEHYRHAKEELFKTRVLPGGMAILHTGLPHLQSLQEICRERQISVWTYGANAQELALLATSPRLTGQEVTVRLFGQEHTFFLPFCGAFQAENILGSIGVVHASGIPLSHILEHLSALTPVPGRLECVGHTVQGAAVYVDYSHKPQALQVALESVRRHTAGQLHLVFGCGGNRDTGKRPEMGAIAHQLADHIMVTDDNPRNEDPKAIRAEILATCPKALEEGDRTLAIQKSIVRLKAGDSLLIAGKGHETTQIRGNQLVAFDDRRIAQDMLTLLGSVIN